MSTDEVYETQSGDSIPEISNIIQTTADVSLPFHQTQKNFSHTAEAPNPNDDHFNNTNALSSFKPKNNDVLNDLDSNYRVS